MSGTSKPDLARAGTMEITAEEAAVYLDKNLTEWKKPYLMNTEGDEDTEGDEEEENDAAEKDEENVDEDADEEEETEREDEDEAPRLAKYSTMKETTEEGEEYLNDQGRPDKDAVTRGQQRKLDEIYAEEPAAKAPRLAKASTMTETVAAGKAFIARHRRRHITELFRVKTEAEALCGKIRMTEGIWMRKRMARANMAKLNQEETLNETTPAGQAWTLKDKAELIKRLQRVKQLKMRKRRASRKSPAPKVTARGRRLSQAVSRNRSKHLSKASTIRHRSRTQDRRTVSKGTRNMSRRPAKRSVSPARRTVRAARRIVSRAKRSSSPARRSVSPGKIRKSRADRMRRGNRRVQAAKSRSVKSRGNRR